MNKKEQQLRDFKNCAEYAPEGTYVAAEELNELIGDAVDNLIRALRKAGYKANNCDGAFALEAEVYQYVKTSNPDNPEFAVSEGFGSAMDMDCRDRVIANAIRDRDAFLRLTGALK